MARTDLKPLAHHSRRNTSRQLSLNVQYAVLAWRMTHLNGQVQRLRRLRTLLEGNFRALFLFSLENNEG
ncbi:hypothetical protein ASE11_01175 [Hydrogenophaga sp. Root209]|nr:hypothetical protein ASE11_01175 [Hydrogenophaga sp. Root209]